MDHDADVRRCRLEPGRVREHGERVPVARFLVLANGVGGELVVLARELIRLAAVDRPGTFAAITKHLADEGISLESIMQRRPGGRPHGGDDPRSPATPAPVILITYATTEDAVRRALTAIKNDGVIAGQPQVIRIEKN